MRIGSWPGKGIFIIMVLSLTATYSLAESLYCEIRFGCSDLKREYCIKRPAAAQTTRPTLYSVENDCIKISSFSYICTDKNGVKSDFSKCYSSQELKLKLVDAGCCECGDLMDASIKIDHQIEEELAKQEREQQKKAEVSKAASLSAKQQREANFRTQGCDFLITNWRWADSAGGSYAVAEGELKNLTEARQELIKVHISFYTTAGDFVSSGWNYTQYQVIMPNQATPFRVSTNFNPMMKSAKIMVTDNADRPVHFCQDKK